MRLIDGYLMSLGDHDEILPSMDEKDIPANAGGLVFDPSDGISENVGVLDLKSLYPSGIISGNISTETLTKDEDEADILIPWMPEKEEEMGGEITKEDVEWDIDRGVGVKLDGFHSYLGFKDSTIAVRFHHFDIAVDRHAITRPTD